MGKEERERYDKSITQEVEDVSKTDVCNYRQKVPEIQNKNNARQHKQKTKVTKSTKRTTRQREQDKIKIQICLFRFAHSTVHKNLDQRCG